MKIIVGLGNPGTKYEFTRHNAGFLMVDFYANENNFEIKKLKFKGLVGETIIGGEKVIFLKPQTFMNLSGDSVREIADFYNANMEDVLIIYDDISIPLGRIRVRKKGSAGGHNGIKDIILKSGTDVFPRIKIGVSENKNTDLVNYVLGAFSKNELEILRKVALAVTKVIETFVTEGADRCMNLYNSFSAEENND